MKVAVQVSVTVREGNEVGTITAGGDRKTGHEGMGGKSIRQVRKVDGEETIKGRN